MSIRSLLSPAAAVVAAALASSVAVAGEPAPVYGAKSVGAMYWEAAGVATTPAEIARQGGGATAATVRWTSGPAAQPGSVYGFGSVGALTRETAGLATSQTDVVRQGGAATALAVRWVQGQAGS